MEKSVEFTFEEGGQLHFEITESGLMVRLQAKHPSENWKTTSVTAVLSQEQIKTLKDLLGEI